MALLFGKGVEGLEGIFEVVWEVFGGKAEDAAAGLPFGVGGEGEGDRSLGGIDFELGNFFLNFVVFR